MTLQLTDILNLGGMRTRILAIVALAGLALVACGGDTGSGDPSEPTDSTAVAPVTTTTTTEGADEMDDEMDNDGIADEGDLVEVHYRGTLDDGTEFDSSEGRDPLSFTVGSGQVIAGFDDAVRGLEVGESRTVRIEPADAYGERTDAAIIEFPASSAPEGLQVGDQVQFGNGQPGTVLEITEETITIDANHPLAGEALTFEVELIRVSG